MDGYLRLSASERKSCLKVYRRDPAARRTLVLLLLAAGRSYRDIAAAVLVGHPRNLRQRPLPRLPRRPRLPQAPRRPHRPPLPAQVRAGDHPGRARLAASARNHHSQPPAGRSTNSSPSPFSGSTPVACSSTKPPTTMTSIPSPPRSGFITGLASFSAA